jgi:hypothetical protein
MEKIMRKNIKILSSKSKNDILVDQTGLLSEISSF